MRSIKTAFPAMAVLSLIFSFTSCDYPLFVHYTVTNNSQDSISLNFTCQWNNWRGISETSDTSILIAPQKTDTIYTYRSIGPSVYNPEFGNDTLKNIFNFKITRNDDTTAVKKDICLLKNWTVKQTKSNILVFNYTF